MNSNPPPLPVGRVKMSWFEFNKKNKPQGNSVAGGLCLMLVSGLHISYGIFNIDLTILYPTLVRSSWYVGVILGGFAAYFLIAIFEKKIFYYMGAVACAIGSVMFFEPISNYVEFIIIGRFIAGVGHGLVYMPLIIHSGENSVKELRGMLLASINFCIMISVVTGAIFNFMISADYINPRLLLAILGVFYSAMAFIYIPLMFYESPVFLINKNREREALVNMMKLRSEQNESWEIRTDFEDLKLMVQEDKQISSNIFNDNNLRPLAIVTLSKLLHSISFNYPLNLFRLSTVVLGFLFNGNYYFWIPIALVITRSSIGVIPLLTMDKIGRKPLFSISAVLCGVTIITLATLFKIFSRLLLVTLITFFLLFDIFSSFGIGMVPDVLASEAFSIPKKALSITFANTVDAIFNLILIIVTPYLWSDAFIYCILFGFGLLLVVGATCFYLKVPETRQMSLRQSRDVLRGTINHSQFQRNI